MNSIFSFFFWPRQIPPNTTHRDKTLFESRFFKKIQKNRSSLNEKKFAAGSTSLDPYLVVHSLENSLVAKDPSFQSVSIPQPVLEKSSSRQLTGLGITIGSRSLSATLTDLSLSRSLTTATSTTSHSASGARLIVASNGEKDDHATCTFLFSSLEPVLNVQRKSLQHTSTTSISMYNIVVISFPFICLNFAMLVFCSRLLVFPLVGCCTYRCLTRMFKMQKISGQASDIRHHFRSLAENHR